MWVDLVADHVSEVLTVEALELELVVFYDKVTETLHAVGFDGAPARYFRSMDAATVPSESPPPRGTPMENIQNPAAKRPETSAVPDLSGRGGQVLPREPSPLACPQDGARSEASP